MSDRTRREGRRDGLAAAIARKPIPDSVRNSNDDYSMGYVDACYEFATSGCEIVTERKLDDGGIHRIT